MNPVAITLFIGMILTILIYSVLDSTGTMTRLGRFGPILPLICIVCLLFGIYHGIKRLKRRASRVRIKGPLFMRSLMNDCLDRTCGELEKQLKTPHLSSVMILNAILQDKVLHICAVDCLRFSDIRRQIEGSRLKGTIDLQLAYFLQTEAQYHKQALPDEIQQASDTIVRSRPDLANHLEGLKVSHRALCTDAGDILEWLPPDEKKVERICTTYRYRPPTKRRAQRMTFALETMTYLKAIRHENVNPLDCKRYESVAGVLIPKLAHALNRYRQAWQDLVDAFEQPQSKRDRP